MKIWKKKKKQNNQNRQRETTNFCKLICCKCHRPLGRGIINNPTEADSILPSISAVVTGYDKITFYCDNCYKQTVL